MKHGFLEQKFCATNPSCCLVADEPVTIGNVPHLHDVTTMMELLGQFGVKLMLNDKMHMKWILDP